MTRGGVNDDWTFIFGWTGSLKHWLSWERQTNNVRDSLQLFFIMNCTCFVLLSFHPSMLNEVTFHLFVCLRMSHVMSDCTLLQTRNDWSLVSSSSETLYHQMTFLMTRSLLYLNVSCNCFYMEESHKDKWRSYFTKIYIYIYIYIFFSYWFRNFGHTF